MPRKVIDVPILTAAEQQQITATINQLKDLLIGKLIQLSAEDRQTYGSVHEQNKLFINKIQEINASQPALASPYIDWQKFNDTHQNRGFIEQSLLILAGIVHDLESTKIGHDYNNYTLGLLDYENTQMLEKHGATGALQKVEEIRQFFPGRPRKEKEDETTEEDKDKAKTEGTTEEKKE